VGQNTEREVRRTRRKGRIGEEERVKEGEEME
jgi:hypothetical protein